MCIYYFATSFFITATTNVNVFIFTYPAVPDSWAMADLWEQINNVLEDSPAQDIRHRSAGRGVNVPLYLKLD